MSKPLGTFPFGPGARSRILDQGLKVSYAFSGEITASKSSVPIYAPDFAGKVYDVNLCVDNGGKDNNALAIEGELKIGGTSVFTTKPKITHVSGESAVAQSTYDTGTGITKAVVDAANNSFNAGEVLMFSYALTRTASPITEMANLVVVVDLIE